MEIRMLNQQELLPSLHLVWEVFAEDVAPQYTPEGVREFQNFIKYEQLFPRFQRGDIIFFGAYEGAELCGTLALMSDGHLALFYVRKNWQRKGIGRMLFQAAYNDCVRLGVRKMTVHSAPSAVEAYRHLGMQQTGDEQTESGIAYVPMELFVIPGLVRPVKKSKTPVILAVVIGVVLLAAIGIGGFFLVRNVLNIAEQTVGQQDPFRDYDGEDGLYDEGNNGYDGSKDDTGEMTGIDAIEAYISDDLSYELTEDTYSETGEPNSSVTMDFYVNYPVIDGLENTQIQDTVNEALKNCALQTVDEIYENPSNEVRDRVLQADTPMLVSYVEYKVCYADNDFLSVVFEDNSYKGSEEYYDPSLRTVNISLKDGAEYQVKDVVDLSDEFLEKWVGIMQDEAGNREFLSELDKEDMRSTLSGNSEENVYIPNFFVDADGIEIGYDLNYPANDPNDLGYIWVTAPFSFEDLKPFKTDSGFWNLIKD